MNDFLRRLLGLQAEPPPPVAPQLGGALPSRPLPTRADPSRVYPVGAQTSQLFNEVGGQLGGGAGTAATRPAMGVPQALALSPDDLNRIDAANPLPATPASLGSLDGAVAPQPAAPAEVTVQPRIVPGNVTILPTIPISPLSLPPQTVVQGKTIGERTPAYLQRSTPNDFFNTAKPKDPRFKQVDQDKLERAQLEQRLGLQRRQSESGAAIEREDERLGGQLQNRPNRAGEVRQVPGQEDLRQSRQARESSRTQREGREQAGLSTQEADARLALSIRQELERRRKENLLRVLTMMR